MYKGKRVACVIPALNEEQAIARVVKNLLALKNDCGQPVIDQLVVCDNGSTDATAANARAEGALVVYEPIPGYGRACLTAITAIQGCDYLLFVDGDDSCFTIQAPQLLEVLSTGADLCIGSRVLGHIERTCTDTSATAVWKLVVRHNHTRAMEYPGNRSRSLSSHSLVGLPAAAYGG